MLRRGEGSERRGGGGEEETGEERKREREREEGEVGALLQCFPLPPLSSPPFLSLSPSLPATAGPPLHPN